MQEQGDNFCTEENNIYTDIGIKQVKLDDRKVSHVRDGRQKWLDRPVAGLCRRGPGLAGRRILISHVLFVFFVHFYAIICTTTINILCTCNGSYAKYKKSLWCVVATCLYLWGSRENEATHLASLASNVFVCVHYYFRERKLCASWHELR